jgi:UPF0716 family protein affecting phage T7 exclusion
MTTRRALPVAVTAAFLVLGIAGAALRAQGEHGVFVGVEALLGFWEGLMTGVVVAAVATVLARAAGLSRSRTRSAQTARG